MFAGDFLKNYCMFWEVSNRNLNLKIIPSVQRRVESSSCAVVGADAV